MILSFFVEIMKLKNLVNKYTVKNKSFDFFGEHTIIFELETPYVPVDETSFQQNITNLAQK